MRLRFLQAVVISGACCGAAVGPVEAAPRVAGVLVLTGGARLETSGAWRVEGRRVIFTTPEGKLVSVAAAEVDFARSRVLDPATAEELRAKSLARGDILAFTAPLDGSGPAKKADVGTEVPKAKPAAARSGGRPRRPAAGAGSRGAPRARRPPRSVVRP